MWFSVLAQGEAEEGGSNLALVLPDKAELIAGVVAFAIVFFFVWKWALPAIDRSLEARQAAISGHLTEAQNAKAESESLRATYEAQIGEARSRGNQIIEESRRTAEQMKSDILAKAQTEAESLVAKAREEANSEKARALAEARREVANLSIDLAQMVVQKNLDRETQLGLVESYLADLEKM